MTNPEVSEVLKQYGALEPLNPEEQQDVMKLGTEQDQVSVPGELLKDEENKEIDLKAVNDPSSDIRGQISKMNVPQKIKLALFGNSICRGLLIRDTNKLIPMFVLKNPRLTLPEVEDFAKSSHISDQVLRHIANNSTWMRTYAIKYHLVTNPKTPGDIALKWLRYLNLPELRRIAKSKNVPQVVSVNARKKVADSDRNK